MLAQPIATGMLVCLKSPLEETPSISLALVSVSPIVTANERDEVIMHVPKNAEVALQMMQLVGLLKFISQCIHSVSVCRVRPFFTSGGEGGSTSVPLKNPSPTR